MNIDGIVNRITAAIACGQCGNELPADNGSGDFCDIDCQSEWYQARTTNPHDVLRRPELLLSWGSDNNPRHRFESDQSLLYRAAHVTFEVPPPPPLEVRDVAECSLLDGLLLDVDSFDEPGLWQRLRGWYRRRKAGR